MKAVWFSAGELAAVGRLNDLLSPCSLNGEGALLPHRASQDARLPTGYAGDGCAEAG